MCQSILIFVFQTIWISCHRVLKSLILENRSKIHSINIKLKVLRTDLQDNCCIFMVFKSCLIISLVYYMFYALILLTERMWITEQYNQQVTTKNDHIYELLGLLTLCKHIISRFHLNFSLPVRAFPLISR